MIRFKSFNVILTHKILTLPSQTDLITLYPFPPKIKSLLLEILFLKNLSFFEIFLCEGEKTPCIHHIRMCNMNIKERTGEKEKTRARSRGMDRASAQFLGHLTQKNASAAERNITLNNRITVQVRKSATGKNLSKTPRHVRGILIRLHSLIE